MPTITRPGDAQPHAMHGFTFTPLATPSRGSSQLALWTVDAPPRSASPEHSMSHDEVFVVQGGRLVGTVESVDVELTPGDALTVPADARLRLTNPYDEPARLIACTTAGMTATVGNHVIAPPWAA